MADDPAKSLLPFLQRADELKSHEPLVAYYCRMYAMDKGLQIPATERTKATKDLLIAVMKQLEKDKQGIKPSPEDNLYLEGFAQRVFAKADKQDRAGKADISTAKTFYASSIFFEVLRQFGEQPPDIEQKQKYALWKAADIRKALSQGLKPTPGPPLGEQEELEAEYAGLGAGGGGGGFGGGAGGAQSEGGGYGAPASADPLGLPSVPVAPPSSPPTVPDTVHHNPLARYQQQPSSTYSFAGRSPSPTSSSSLLPPHLQQPQQPPSSYSQQPPSSYSQQPPSSYLQQLPSSYAQQSPSSYSQQPPSSYSQQPPSSYLQQPPSLFPQDNSMPSSAPDHSGPIGPSSFSPSPPPPGSVSPLDGTPASLPHFSSYPLSSYPLPPSAPPPAPSATSSYTAGSYSSSAPSTSSSSPPSFDHWVDPSRSSGPSLTQSGVEAAAAAAAARGVLGGGSSPGVGSGEGIPTLGPSGAPSSSFPVSHSYSSLPPSVVVEAHKQARFAVSALAFDDVPTAVDYLKKALNLLTKDH